MDHGERKTVGQLMIGKDGKHGAALARVGLRLYSDKGEFFLFIDPKPVKKQLLKGGDMARLEIDQILLRVDGATSPRVRLAGKQPRGVKIPMDEVAKLTGLGGYVTQDESEGGEIGSNMTVQVPPPKGSTPPENTTPGGIF